MEPTVIAAIIAAAGSLTGKLIEAWKHDASNSSENAKLTKKANEVVHKLYDQLSSNVTKNSLRILLFLEDGEPRRDTELWKRVFPKKRTMSSEFGYRLRFLETIGLIRKGQSEYRISRLGRAFLSEARERKDYPKSLFS